MATGVITHTETDPSGTSVGAGHVVEAMLMPSGGFRISDFTGIARREATTTDAAGTFTLTLENNANIDPPDDSFWLITIDLPESLGGPKQYPIVVNGNSTLYAALVAPDTDAYTSLYLTQAAGDARYARLGSGVLSVEAIVTAAPYNADPTGTVDATSAIQLALTAVNALGGGVVKCPEGTYLVNGSPLKMGSNTTLSGAGTSATKFHCTRATGSHFLGIVSNLDQVAGNTDLHVEGIWFNRTVEVAFFDEHIFFKFCQRMTVRKCRFTGDVSGGFNSNKGVHFQGCLYGLVEDNTFSNIADNAVGLSHFYASGITDGQHCVRGNRFFRDATAAGSSMIMCTVNHVVITGNQISLTSRVSCNWFECGQPTLGTNIKCLTLSNNTVINAESVLHGVSGATFVGNSIDTGSIRVASVTAGVSDRNNDIVCIGNIVTVGDISLSYCDESTITGNQVSSSPSGGIGADKCSRPTISNNTVWNCVGNGINVLTTVAQATIIDNRSYNNGSGGVNTYGINLDGDTTYSIISGNKCYDTRAGGARTQTYGLFINIATLLIFTDNVFYNHLTGNFTTSGTITYAYRSGNIFEGGVIDRVSVGVVATASLPAAAAAMSGTVIIEDAGAGDRNLIIYGSTERFRIDGGAPF